MILTPAGNVFVGFIIATTERTPQNYNSLVGAGPGIYITTEGEVRARKTNKKS